MLVHLRRGKGTNSGAVNEQYVLSPYRPHIFLGLCSTFAWLFTVLDDILGRVERMEQSWSRTVLQAIKTTDTSGNEKEGSEPRRTIRSKRTSKLKKVIRRMS